MMMTIELINIVILITNDEHNDDDDNDSDEDVKHCEPWDSM